MQRRSAIAGLGLIALASCAPRGNGRAVLEAPPASRAWRSSLQREHPLVGAIWSVSAERRSDSPDLAQALRVARFRLIGEVHDNPDHHAIQLDLLGRLGDSGLKPAVAFEQFDAEHAADLRQRLSAGNATAEDVADAVRFDRKGWDWNYYRPLVDFALRHGFPLRAANLSTSAARPIVKDGLRALGAERVTGLRIEQPWSPERERVLRRIIFDAHCAMLPEHLLPRLADAQRARDATLAEALLDSGSDGAVLIAGNGHARRDLGVPLYLAAAGGSTCAVGILEVEAGMQDPRDYLEGAVAGQAMYDFVCFTPQWARPDPCAAFKPGGNR